MGSRGFSALRNLSFLKYRHKAEGASAGLPGLVAAAEKAAQSLATGDHAQRRAGRGEKFWQFREYDTHSHRPQDIDWRQSAKGDRLFVREKEWQVAQTAFVWCQNTPGMDYRSDEKLPTKQENAIILTLATGLLLLRAGEQIAPLESGTAAGRSERAIDALGRTALETKTGTLPAAAGRRIPAHSSLVMAGDFLAPLAEIEKTFAALAAQAANAMVIQILDPAELTLPFAGRAVFQPPASPEKFQIDNVETVRAAYRQRIQTHIDGVREICRRHGWHWLLHTTDGAVRDTLFDAWTVMAPESFHHGRGRQS